MSTRHANATRSCEQTPLILAVRLESLSYAGELMRISAFLVRVNVYITKPDRLRTVPEVPTPYSELPGAGRGIDIRPSSPNARFKSPRCGCGVAYPACSCRNSGFCRPPGGQHDQSSILRNAVRPACLREGGSNKQDVVSEATRQGVHTFPTLRRAPSRFYSEGAGAISSPGRNLGLIVEADDVQASILRVGVIRP